MLIYKLTFASGKAYIGQTVRSLKRRLNQHRRAALELGSELAVHHAWRKYGEPVVEVLADAVESEDKLHELERSFIESLGTLSPHGYNLTVGGDFAPSRMPEVARKIGEKSKGREVTEDTRAKIAESVKAHWCDEDYRAKVSAGLRAAVTDERRQAAAKRSDALWAKRKAEGWTMPETQREKLRNKVVSDETRARMSESAKARKREKFSDEHKEKIRANVTASWGDEEVRAKRSAAISEALKAKREELAEAARKRWADPAYRAAVLEAKARKRLAKDSGAL